MNTNQFKSQSIIFATLISEAERRINEFKSIQMDMTEYENRLKEIKKDIYNEISDLNDFKNETNKKQDPTTYNNTISKLTDLIDDLKNYEEYYIVSNKAIYIVEQLVNNGNINFDFLIDEANNLLDYIEDMPTDDYDKQKSSIGTSYKAIYNIMMLESLLKTNTILTRIKSSEVHSSYISNLILDESNQLNDNLVNNRIKYLKSKGMDSNILIDKELFQLIALCKDENYLKQVKEETIEKYNKYNQCLDELKSTAHTLENRAYDYKRKSKETSNDLTKLIKRLAFTAACIGTSSLLTISAYKWLDRIDNLYRIKGIEYNLETGESKEGELWDKFDKHNVLVIEENPWTTNKGVYVKYTNYYNFKSIPNSNAKDYVNIAKQSSPNKSSEKIVEEKPNNYGNEKAKYRVIIKEYTNDYSDGNSEGLWILFCVILAVILYIVYEFSYESVYSAHFSITDIKDKTINCIDDKKSKNSIEKSMKADIKRIYELINTCNELYSFLKDNPAYLRLCPEIDKIMEDLNADAIIDEYAPSTNKKLVKKTMHK